LNRRTFTPHDSTQIENIVDATDKELHADSAYSSKEIEKFLTTQNCKNNVHAPSIPANS
jgi:hypothetical protein